MDNNKNKIIITKLASGAIVISMVPLFCNGNVCEPSITPDLPVEGQYFDNSNNFSGYKINNVGSSTYFTAD